MEAIANLKTAGLDLIKTAAVIISGEVAGTRPRVYTANPDDLYQLLEAMDHWEEVVQSEAYFADESDERLGRLMTQVRTKTIGFRVGYLISALRTIMLPNDSRTSNLRGTRMSINEIEGLRIAWFHRKSSELNEDHVNVLEDTIAEIRDGVIIERPNGYPGLNRTRRRQAAFEYIQNELGRELTEAEVKKVHQALDLSYVPAEIVVLFLRDAANDTVPTFWRG